MFSISNEKDAVTAVVDYFRTKVLATKNNQNKTEVIQKGRISAIFEYIRKNKMTKRNSLTKAFMNVYLINLKNSVNGIDELNCTSDWKKQAKVVCKQVFTLSPNPKVTKNIANIGNKITAMPYESRWGDLSIERLKIILNNMIVCIGKNLKKGFPYKCYKKLNENRIELRFCN